MADTDKLPKTFTADPVEGKPSDKKDDAPKTPTVEQRLDRIEAIMNKYHFGEMQTHEFPE